MGSSKAKQRCMECKNEYGKYELQWVNDNYGIPLKKVCHDCYSPVLKKARANFHGDEHIYVELYRENY